VPRIFRTCALAGLFTVLVWFSMDLRGSGTLSTLIWPAGGVFLGILLRAERRHWLGWIVATSLIHLAFGLAAGRSVPVAAVFVLAQALVTPLIAWAWLSRARAPFNLDSLHNLARFLAAIIVGSALSALIVTFGLSLVGTSIHAANWVPSVISDLVGRLIGAQLILAWLPWTPQRSGGLNSVEFRRGALWFTLLVITTYLVFDGPVAESMLGSTRYELSYVPVLFLVLVAMQWGSRGLAFSLLVVAWVTIEHGLQGEGPFATAGEPVGVALLELQIYLGAMALLGMVMNAIASGRNRALRQAAHLKQRFETALACSQHLAYEYDPRTHSIEWGGDTLALLGLPDAQLQTLDAFLARVHADDVATLRAAASRKLEPGDLETGQPRTLRFRFRCGDEQYRLVTDIGAPLGGLDQDVLRLSGLLRIDDIESDTASR